MSSEGGHTLTPHLYGIRANTLLLRMRRTLYATSKYMDAGALPRRACILPETATVKLQINHQPRVKAVTLCSLQCILNSRLQTMCGYAVIGPSMRVSAAMSLSMLQVVYHWLGSYCDAPAKKDRCAMAAKRRALASCTSSLPKPVELHAKVLMLANDITNTSVAMALASRNTVARVVIRAHRVELAVQRL